MYARTRFNFLPASVEEAFRRCCIYLLHTFFGIASVHGRVYVRFFINYRAIDYVCESRSGIFESLISIYKWGARDTALEEARKISETFRISRAKLHILYVHTLEEADMRKRVYNKSIRVCSFVKQTCNLPKKNIYIITLLTAGHIPWERRKYPQCTLYIHI